MSKNAPRGMPSSQQLAAISGCELWIPGGAADLRSVRIDAQEGVSEASGGGGALQVDFSVGASRWRHFLWASTAAEMTVSLEADSPWRRAVSQHLSELVVVVESLHDRRAPLSRLARLCCGGDTPSRDALACIMNTRMLGTGARIVDLASRLPYVTFVELMDNIDLAFGQADAVLSASSSRAD